MIGDLLNRIEEGIPSFSKGQRRIARYMIEHYEQAAYMTAARIGAEVGVSESTFLLLSLQLLQQQLLEQLDFQCSQQLQSL